MSRFEIVDAGQWMPAGLAELAAESAAVGIRNVSALARDWADGTQRFSQSGERLLVAIGANPAGDAEDEERSVVGVGGLTRCPHVDGALRVRRFYVANAWRRRGVARAIAMQLLADGREHTHLFTCNARASAAAPPFWESLGFVPTNQVDGITHRLGAAP